MVVDHGYTIDESSKRQLVFFPTGTVSLRNVKCDPMVDLMKHTNDGIHCLRDILQILIMNRIIRNRIKVTLCVEVEFGLLISMKKLDKSMTLRTRQCRYNIIGRIRWRKAVDGKTRSFDGNFVQQTDSVITRHFVLWYGLSSL